jgi:hypothetical protein
MFNILFAMLAKQMLEDAAPAAAAAPITTTFNATQVFITACRDHVKEEHLISALGVFSKGIFKRGVLDTSGGRSMPLCT